MWIGYGDLYYVTGDVLFRRLLRSGGGNMGFTSIIRRCMLLRRTSRERPPGLGELMGVDQEGTASWFGGVEGRMRVHVTPGNGSAEPAPIHLPVVICGAPRRRQKSRVFRGDFPY